MTDIAPTAGRGLRIEPLALAAGLPRLQPDAVRASRIACDDRFQQWLAGVLQSDRIRCSHRAPAAPQVVFALETAQGGLRLGVAQHALPAAAACVLGMADRALALEVLTTVFQRLFAAFEPVFTQARVVGIEAGGPGDAGLVVEGAAVAVTLCSASGPLLAHVARLLDGTSATLHPWGALALRARLRLAVRHWRPAFIESLRRGDVVLLPPAPVRGKVIVGTGVTMQADVEMSLEPEQVEAAGGYEVMPDELPAIEGPTASVQDLQLPVAFEIDTARISLAELAGMQAGYVIELDVALAQAAVRLVCQAQVIGQGQLVAVGERLGVRIDRMGLDHGAAAQR
jgi:type III secretion protein Q